MLHGQSIAHHQKFAHCVLHKEHRELQIVETLLCNSLRVDEFFVCLMIMYIVYVHVLMEERACMYVGMCVRMYACMYVCMYMYLVMFFPITF